MVLHDGRPPFQDIRLAFDSQVCSRTPKLTRARPHRASAAASCSALPCPAGASPRGDDVRSRGACTSSPSCIDISAEWLPCALPMATLSDDPAPSVLLDHTDHVSDLHGNAIPLLALCWPQSLTIADTFVQTCPHKTARAFRPAGESITTAPAPPAPPAFRRPAGCAHVPTPALPTRTHRAGIRGSRLRAGADSPARAHRGRS